MGIRAGQEFALVFIASSTCTGITHPDLKPAIHRLFDEYRAQAVAAGDRLIGIGVSTDWDVATGVSLLEEYGPFDEIMTGRGWLNSGAVKYIWNDLPGGAGLPQVLLVRRRVRSDEAALGVDSEEVVFRKIGAQSIIDWVSLTYPLER